MNAMISFAQKTTVKGRVYDSSRHSGLSYTTVSLVRADDSTLITFTRADSTGAFTLNSVDRGKYLLSASYVGYIPVWKAVEINSTTLQNIGNINMQDISSAGNVTVTAKRPPVEINNDTLEFNTENFKTQPNAVVEDMLKKMPGISIDKDGTVKINGQTVKRVLVNGREFFTGDIKAATQNLPADAVDKVQVFDKQTDQSAFTGVDDGNSEKTINLKLKKDNDNALFGKLTAGAGNDGHFDAQANINKFKGKEQLSFLGMSNNTNRQGFQITDMLNFTGELARGMRNGGGVVIRTDDNNSDNGGLPVTGLGQNQQGVATTTAGGINYNNLWNKDKTDWSSNYLASDVHLVTNKESNMQTVLPGLTLNRYQSGNTVNDNIQHRINVILDQKIDSSFSFKITPSITFQHSNKKAANRYNETTADGVKLNDGYTSGSSGADAFNFTNNMLLRKRFKKKGRTVSLNMSMGYNHSKMNGSQYSENNFYNTDGSKYDSSLNQRYDRDAVAGNFGSTIIYTEPLGKRSLFEFSGFYNTNIGNSNKNTYDYNDATSKYDTHNAMLSNNFKSNYTYTGGGINFRTNQKKLNITTGLQLQSAALKTANRTTQENIQKDFIDLLPNVLLQYNISRMKNLRFEYNASTTQPSLTQLQPLADVSDPLNIVIGNPDLKRTYNQNIQLNLFAANPARRKNLFGFLNFSTSSNAIVRSDTIKPNGARISSYTNTNGTYSIFENLEFGFPLKKLKSRIDLGSSARFTMDASFVNGERNDIHAWSLGPNLSYHFGIDNKIDLDVTASVSVNSTKYSLQQFTSNNYLHHEYGIDITNYFAGNIYLHNEFNYILNTGRTDGYNTKIPLWNMSLAKSVLKNKRGEFKFSVQDILNKNTGITRSSNQGYIIDEKYNVLQRYFLLSFTFSLNKSGLNRGGPNVVIKTFNN